MKLPKILYLDYSTWRCGKNSRIKENKMGRGKTLLRNKEGFSCCLGQWVQQTDPDLTKNELAVPEPTDLLYCIGGLIEAGAWRYNSEFSKNCISINDDKDTTIRKKISLLRKEVKEIGRKLIARGFPK